MIILPQKKKDKKTQQMLNSLQVGWSVTTIGGIVGKIINIKDTKII
jgi:preprotein translocase subunit YajC